MFRRWLIRLLVLPLALGYGILGLACAQDKEAGILPAEALAPELQPGIQPPGVQPIAKPNIIFITIDALSAKHVGVYGNTGIKTPTLDGLAQKGVKFNLEINSASQTGSSMASIFTSSYPASNGVLVHGLDRLSDSLPTLAGILANNGYGTAALYSSRILDSQFSGLDRGFETYQPVYLPNPGQTDIWRLFSGLADVTTDAVLSWLKQKPNTPFFLWVHYDDPHYPYAPPAPFDTMYDTCNTCVDGGYDTIDRIAAGEQLSDRDIMHLVALYDGEVSFADRE
ncbi:MAG: sulfatase-like hydrolase/transferase, partial [Dehalococcoidia bacterium]|nr:sulfatase-like hydrolase/transferase [Dehalococcoidia bacterium]